MSKSLADIPVTKITFRLFGTDRVTLHAFGAPINWHPGMELENIAPCLATYVLQYDVMKILAPCLDFSARLCAEKELRQVKIVKGVRIYRHDDGLGADAVLVPRGQAAFFYSADCPTLLVYDPISYRLAVAHAGRECLYDKNRLGGGSSREHESVIDTVLEAFPGVNPSGLLAHSAVAIGGKNFTHSSDDPRWGAWNQKMLQHLGCLDHGLSGRIFLHEVIRRQLIVRGLNPDNVTHDEIDTFGDGLRTKNRPWWSERRRAGNPNIPSGRNGILVIHH